MVVKISNKRFTHSFIHSIICTYFVEDDPLEIADDVAAVVEHGAENLRRHDQAGRRRVYLNVARHCNIETHDEPTFETQGNNLTSK